MAKEHDKPRMGVVAVDPLRFVGLSAILEEGGGVLPVALSLEMAIQDESLAAVLLDARTAGDGLLDLIARLRRERPEVKVMVMGQSLPAEQVQAVIGAGARGFLLETAGEQDIRMAIEVVLDGSIWAPRKMLAKLLDASAGSAAPGRGGALGSVEGLMTPRELDVLRLLMDGRSNREIARGLGIDEVTVKAHLGRMLRKTGLNNRVELTLRAMEDRAPRADLAS